MNCNSNLHSTKDWRPLEKKVINILIYRYIHYYRIIIFNINIWFSIDTNWPKPWPLSHFPNHKDLYIKINERLTGFSLCSGLADINTESIIYQWTGCVNEYYHHQIYWEILTFYWEMDTAISLPNVSLNTFSARFTFTAPKLSIWISYLNC